MLKGETTENPQLNRSLIYEGEVFQGNGHSGQFRARHTSTA
jgi:hypothetical protein